MYPLKFQGAILLLKYFMWQCLHTLNDNMIKLISSRRFTSQSRLFVAVFYVYKSPYTECLNILQDLLYFTCSSWCFSFSLFFISKYFPSLSWFRFCISYCIDHFMELRLNWLFYLYENCMKAFLLWSNYATDS